MGWYGRYSLKKKKRENGKEERWKIEKKGSREENGGEERGKREEDKEREGEGGKSRMVERGKEKSKSKPMNG